MSYLDQIRKSSEFSSGNFFVLYGKPSSGKTHFAGTFPTPLFISYKDKGLMTVRDANVDFIEFDGSFEEHMALLDEIMTNDTTHQTIVFDTFSVYLDRLQQIMLSRQKKTAMTQQMWGDIGTQGKMLLDKMKEISAHRIVIVCLHESTDSIPGYENELVPSVGCLASPTIKKALYGVANYAFHTFISDSVDPQTSRHTISYQMHIGVNPYYWTKFQTSDQSRVPYAMINPTYDRILALIKG